VRWIWDSEKATLNFAKHRITFPTASLVFDDPLNASKPDQHSDGDRWQTVGKVGPAILFVVHTRPIAETAEESTGRIISARKATPHERRAYEQGTFE
jgi:uncharacterized DUF497 family protein